MRNTRQIFGIALLTGVAFTIGTLCSRGWDAPAVAAPLQDHGSHADHDHAASPGDAEFMERMAAMEEAGRIGVGHRHLQNLVGTFTGTYRMWLAPDAPPIEFPSEVTREWTLDGHYLKETVTAESEDGVFHGLAYLGYDNLEGRYEMVWLDNMSTSVETMHGNYDPSSKIFRTYGTGRDPLTGHTITSWAEMDLSNHDLHTMVGWAVDASGKPYKQFEGTLKRLD
ncbi:MAG: DUF1579 family protein [Phycisphaerales bacterium]|nr:DUF1579 family protein [Phycisphaerales bacterium]